MPLIANEGDGKPKQLPPEGTYAARCYSVIDLGTQETPFGQSHKVRITWELPDEKAVFKEENGEQPFVISKEYTLSLYEKANLRHDLESWRGKEFTAEELMGFDIFTLLGANCMLSIIHKMNPKGKTFANVSSISKLPKAMVCAPPVNPPVSYSIMDGRTTVYEALPEWLRKKIASSEEWTDGVAPPKGIEDEESGSIPF